MWKDNDGNRIDLVNTFSEWREIRSIELVCFKVCFGRLETHKMRQISWCLDNRTVPLYDIKGAIAFLNFLESRDIKYRLCYRWMDIPLLSNIVVWYKWYIPIKLQLIFGRIRQRRYAG